MVGFVWLLRFELLCYCVLFGCYCFVFSVRFWVLLVWCDVAVRLLIACVGRGFLNIMGYLRHLISF